jgi:hypothetical protein
MKPPVSVQPLFESVIKQIAVSTTPRRICLPNVCIEFFPESRVGVFMSAILPVRFWIGLCPDTEIQTLNADVPASFLISIRHFH